MARRVVACGVKLNESQILSAIRQAANAYPALQLWRLSQGGAVSRGGQTYRAGMSVNGASDLLGLFHGRFVAIEVKAERGRLSNDQVMFLELVRRKGGFATVCRSVDEFHRAMARALEGYSQ